MKIIQHGRPKVIWTTKRFKCWKCGCVFEADEEEYESGNQYNATYFWCACPDCGETANEVALRGEK